MPTYAYLYEDLGNIAERDRATQELNVILLALQEEGAKILDVKISTADKEWVSYAQSLLYTKQKGLFNPEKIASMAP